MDYFTPCATVVRDFIRAGASNMVREKRTSEHDFEEADANLARLVSKMIETARAIPNARTANAGPLLIREAAFVKAKEICPLWPFC